MTDTKSQQTGAAQTESDGVNYRGIVVFVAILAITTIMCELIVVGMFKIFDARSQSSGVARAPMSAPAGTLPPPPNLLINEPANLTEFRAREANELNNYGWLDKNAGVVRLPIDRAKELLLERGLPVRGAETPAAAPKKADVKKTEVRK
jgi:hypothetical protein